ncbi:MAG: hypothetical protein ACXW20_04585 [Burkholderiales bacterium]
MLLARIAAVIAIGALCGCARSNLWGSAPARDYFSTKVCGLQVESRTGEARLRLQLVANRALPGGGLVEAEFENPIDRAKPLVTRLALTGREKTLDLFSPPLEAARVRDYQVVARIYSAADKKRLVGEHRQVCQSLFDAWDVR